MTEHKKWFHLAFAVAGLGVAYAAIVYASAFARSIQPSSFRSFAVSGEGKVVAIPDIAQFSFSVTTEGSKDLGKTESDNTNQYNKAVDFLKSKGIAKEDIETTESSITPRSQTYDCRPVIIQGAIRPCPPPEIVGYTVRKSVSVKIRDFSKIGEVMAGVVDNGANEVGGLNFAIDDRTKVESQAREKAIQKAKEKARSIAKAGGFRLGRLLSIDEGGVTPYYDRMSYALESGIGGGATKALPAPSIEPGSDNIVVNITLRYEIN
jgi:uncharacterized protein YggE